MTDDPDEQQGEGESDEAPKPRPAWTPPRIDFAPALKNITALSPGTQQALQKLARSSLVPQIAIDQLREQVNAHLRGVIKSVQLASAQVAEQIQTALPPNWRDLQHGDSGGLLSSANPGRSPSSGSRARTSCARSSTPTPKLSVMRF
jgi:hypothetical protein